MIKYHDFAVRGIDVSEYNGIIDWSKVSADFSAIRVGHGRVTDETFVANWKNAKGKTFRIPYWYLDYYSNHLKDTTAYGISDVDWGRKQAEVYWGLVKDDPTSIVFLDVESASVADKKVQEVWDRVETIARAFLERVDELSGKINGVYCSLTLLSAFSAWFKDRPLWVAWYNEAQTTESVLKAVKAKKWAGKCLIWQYASHGDVDQDGTPDGISMGMQYKFLDLNGWVGSSEDWREFTNMSIYPVLKHPLRGDYRISQLFGLNPSWYTTSKGHNGIDWATPVGTPVYAMQDGVVIRAMDFSQPGMTDGKVGYGRHVRIQHPQGVSIYGHFSRLDVKEGDTVKAGQQLGLSGGAKTDPNSGMSTGAHLHGEYRMDGILNPVPGGYVYNAIDILKYIVAEPVEEDNSVSVYKVKILINNLYVRSGAGSNYPVVQRYATGVQDVYEEKNGYGRIGVGRWISLNPAYVQKVMPTPEDGDELTDAEKLAILWEWYILNG